MNDKLIHDFSKKPGMAGTLLFSLRHEVAQSHRGAFRHNLQRLGWLLGNAMAEVWPMKDREVQTGLGVAKCSVIKEQPVLATVMRAGLPMHAGVLEVWDQADCAFVSAYRKHNNEGGFDIEIEYLGAPSCKDRILVLVDPMLATGASMVAAYEALITEGAPSQLHVIAAIASPEGVEYAQNNLPKGTVFWIGAIDEGLDDNGYIVPGLGDAGDLSYGAKSRS
ncbi:MAG: uracil phosphoribosyltransferase [Flavobacteriales bacterium]